jgi:hypothetical protein
VTGRAAEVSQHFARSPQSPHNRPARPPAPPDGRRAGRAAPPGPCERDRPRGNPGGGGEVIELEYGITVYPAREGKRPLAYGGERCWRCELWLARRPSSSV